MSSLIADFAAMVTEMRPAWDAVEAKRCTARATWFAAQRSDRPAPRPLTVEDYRARLAAYDSTAHLSDDRSVANAGFFERDALRSMARQFDADLSIWDEIVNRRTPA